MISYHMEYFVVTLDKSLYYRIKHFEYYFLSVSVEPINYIDNTHARTASYRQVKILYILCVDTI